MTVARGTLERALEGHLAPGVKVRGTSPMGGGCINRALRVELSDGEVLFAKVNSPDLPGMFEAEAAGLRALDVPGGPRVPRPVATAVLDDLQLIVTTFIRAGRPGPRYWEEAGRRLATLHLTDVGERYGFDGDNYIGATPQPCGWMEDWVEFFAERRLRYQIRLARRRGLADRSLTRGVEALIRRLGDFLPQSPSPAVLHGDLWSGNIMADDAGAPVIFDPAVYVGHFEAELAMTELFGRFDRRFYAAYDEVNPIPREYEEARRDIYTLYHVLNHLNLFGGGYAGQAAGIVRRLV